MITLLYAGFGTLGYLSFGAVEIEGSITLNLPKDKHLHSVWVDNIKQKDMRWHPIIWNFLPSGIVPQEATYLESLSVSATKTELLK